MTTDVDEDDEYDIFEQSGYLRYAREDAEFTLEHYVTLAVTNDYYGAVAFSVLARDLGVDVETLKARLAKLGERGYITLQEVQCREDIAEYWKPHTPNEEGAILVPGIVMSYLPPDGLAWSDLSKAFRAATGRADGNSLSSASMKVLAAEAKRLRELGT